MKYYRGRNIFGIKEVEKCFGKILSDDQIERINATVIPDGYLKACQANTHFLFIGCPLTIMSMHRLHPTLFEEDFPSSHYAKGGWMKEQKVQTCWHLMRKRILPASYGLHYGAFFSLMEENEKMPRACEIVYALILNFLINNDILYERIMIATRNVLIPNKVRGYVYFTTVGSWEKDNGGLEVHFNGCQRGYGAEHNHLGLTPIITLPS